MIVHLRQAWGAVVAALIALVAVVLTRFITENPEAAAAMTRGVAGPETWPKAMLFMAALCAIGWCVQEGWRAFHEARRKAASAVEEAKETALVGGDVGVEPEEEAVKPTGARIWLGIVLALAYGFVIPVLGFPIATLSFLILWFLLGGIRKPLQVSLVGVIGTVVLLYVFVKLALMPLDRGAGVFGEFTLALYRTLGIF